MENNISRNKQNEKIMFSIYDALMSAKNKDAFDVEQTMTSLFDVASFVNFSVSTFPFASTRVSSSFINLVSLESSYKTSVHKISTS